MQIRNQVFPKHLSKKEKDLIQHLGGAEPEVVDQSLPASSKQGDADLKVQDDGLATSTRVAGEFFTPRAVVQAVVKLLLEKSNSLPDAGRTGQE